MAASAGRRLNAETLLPAAPDVGAAIRDWQAWLADEKRASPHTCLAYRRDLVQFLGFVSGHLGMAPALGDLERLRTGDFRAWLAARNAEGVQRTSTARALSTLRGFFRWLKRRGLADNAALATLRTPKVPKAVPKALARAGMSLKDMKLIEFNEAFAAQALAVIKDLEMDTSKVNVNGGAIALGHPLGASGAKLTVQLIHELGRRDGGLGMVTMCIGGGMGAAGIFEVYAA